jgi:glyoxylase-like metal-dependent hydrolase (beta-lactamase superfamily II)
MGSGLSGISCEIGRVHIRPSSFSAAAVACVDRRSGGRGRRRGDRPRPRGRIGEATNDLEEEQRPLVSLTTGTVQQPGPRSRGAVETLRRVGIGAVSLCEMNLPTGQSWTAPGAHLVAPGVYRIPLPLPTDGLRAVNVYLLETSDGLTCIDGGWAIPESRRLFEDALRSLGHHPRDITSFLVTHVHRDHYSQAVALRSEFGRAAVALGERERDALQAILDARGSVEFVDRLRRCGAPDLAARWAEIRMEGDPDPRTWDWPDRWLAGDFAMQVGNRILHAVHTPGHTEGHYVFADLEAGLLFSGDHVLPTITPSVGFTAGLTGDAERRPLGDFLGSLAKVQALPDLRLLPAHGDANRHSHERVAELMTHHDTRLELCLAAVAAGSATAIDVADALSWTRHEHQLKDLDPFNAGLAVMETSLHLYLLDSRGEVERTVVDGVETYRLPDTVCPPRGERGEVAS